MEDRVHVSDRNGPIGSGEELVLNSVRQHVARWKANPRRLEFNYVASRVLASALAHVTRNQRADEYVELVTPPIEGEFVEILLDPEFRQSVTEVKNFTCLDVARLANLWMLAKIVGAGTFLEVGTYQGGTALHLCNAMNGRDAPFYCFDPFESHGFQGLAEGENHWSPSDFTDTSYEQVAALLGSKPFAKAIRGFFPEAAQGVDLSNIAFCHLDVDIFDATLRSLEHIAPRLAPRGLIVVDDTGHNRAPGVKRAVAKFLTSNPSFVSIPMFPCQSVLLPKHLW
jgi:O-methyltransferase